MSYWTGRDEPKLETIYEEAYQGAKKFFTLPSERFVDEEDKGRPRKIGFV